MGEASYSSERKQASNDDYDEFHLPIHIKYAFPMVINK